MQIPDSFKTEVASTFYDKSVKLLNYTEVTDNEGFVQVQSGTTESTFMANVRFDNLAQVQEAFGLEEQIDIILTTGETVSVGNVLEYDSIEYRVTGAIPYDSHNLITGIKWERTLST